MLRSWTIIERKFSSLVDEVDRSIRSLLDSIDMDEISRHNVGYFRYAEDKFRYFVQVEKRRFLKALDWITAERSNGTVCDLGCFVPYLPLALAKLGYEAKIVDKYGLYGPIFRNAIAKFADSHSIALHDLDILQDDFAALGENDIVLLMAVVEHLNGTPRDLMSKIRTITRLNGFLVFEVPNMVEFVKRVRFLLGKSPLPDYEAYLKSAYPFTGHNREMTISEVVHLLERSGFAIDMIECYDYDPQVELTSIKGRVAKAIKSLAPVKHKGQSIMAKARLCP